MSDKPINQPTYQVLPFYGDRQPQPIGMKFNLKNARLWRKLSQEQLGSLIGAMQQRVCHLETGRRQPNQTTLLKLAKALDCVIEIHPDGEIKYCPIISRETFFLPNDAQIEK